MTLHEIDMIKCSWMELIIGDEVHNMDIKKVTL